ncbi:MAG: DUF3014 domain-containing protein [Alphaproteobacteria bacterium]
MKRSFLWMIPLVAALGSAALYFWLKSETPQPRPEPGTPAQQPAVRYPIEAPGPQAQPLPPLADSDKALRDALAELFGRNLEKFFNLQDIAHRFVATVDNLPRENLSSRLMPVKPLSGRPVTVKKGESITLSPENAARYRPYVRLAQKVPTGALVAAYKRFYPLFQQQYENLGYPGKYFNDRVVEVIDHLLAAPEVREPVQLTQPGVLYEFADPKLERLSAGQKIMVRMGYENMVTVKAKLRELREALITKVPAREPGLKPSY